MSRPVGSFTWAFGTLTDSMKSGVIIGFYHYNFAALRSFAKRV